MRTLHVGLRVADLDRSLAFYRALGYEVVGQVPETPIGRLTMLKLPDDPFVTIELVHDPDGSPVGPGGLSHLVVAVGSMTEALAALSENGVAAEEPDSPDGSADVLTAMLTDPDGHRIELVQWPADHAEGMTAADFEA